MLQISFSAKIDIILQVGLNGYKFLSDVLMLLNIKEEASFIRV